MFQGDPIMTKMPRGEGKSAEWADVEVFDPRAILVNEHSVLSCHERLHRIYKANPPGGISSLKEPGLSLLSTLASSAHSTLTRQPGSLTANTRRILATSDTTTAECFHRAHQTSVTP